MDINMDNYCEYGRFNHLIKPQKESLFLKPDGVRTRYCIGWNGYGRYIPGTLRVTHNGLPCNIFEEDNGIFYNFEVAPSGNYDDYEVSYMGRPLDYAFSTGAVEGGYEGEEYFLFPNWNNAKGEGDGFWIGKWQASNNGNDTPQSKSGVNYWCNITRDSAINACKNKGKGFGMVTNRRWVSIARWCDHHEIHVKGNIYGNQTNNLDGDGTTLNQCGGGYDASDGDGYHFVTGTTFPDTWNHNGKSNGIHNMVGNVWEFIDGLENRNGEIYIYDENGNYVDSGVSVSSSGNGNIVDIANTSQDIFNEGIANTVNTQGYVPSNLDEDYALYNNGQTNFLRRGGGSGSGLQCGLWTFNVNSALSLSNWVIGFRVARKI